MKITSREADPLEVSLAKAGSEHVDVEFGEGQVVESTILLGTTGQFVFVYDADADRAS